MQKTFRLLLLLAISISPAAAEPPEEKQSYSNPVWDGYLADPAVMHWNGTWYAYGTGTNEKKERFPILRSTDFLKWEYVGYGMDPAKQGIDFWNYWAPEVVEKDGKFYMFFAGSGKMRVAIADKPEGPFINSGVILFPDIKMTIDGHPFRDPDTGEWYLFFARRFFDVEPMGTGIAVIRLGEDLLSVQGPEKTVITSHSDWQIWTRDKVVDGKKVDWYTVEGPWVVKRNGLYYCFYSGSNWRKDTYGVGFTVAKHPMGPWHDSVNLDGPKVLSGKSNNLIGPGHNSIALSAIDGKDFIVFHSWEPTMTNRVMCIAPLNWGENGPYADNPAFGLRKLK